MPSTTDAKVKSSLTLEEEKEHEDYLIRKAESELQEKPEWRDRDIQALRDMVVGENYLTCPTDDAFLLQFLRARKFDYDRSFALLKQYYNIRLNNPELYANFRPSALAKVFKANLQTVLPDRDNEGRRIFFYKAGSWDCSTCTLDDLFRANQMCLESIIKEEETQINGIVAIIDMKDMGMNQIKYITPSYLKKVISLLQDCIPARFKGFHIVNEPAVIDVIMALVKPFLSEKLRNRLYFHGSGMESVHEYFSPEILPEELGGLKPSMNNSDFYSRLLEEEENFIKESQYGYSQSKLEEIKKMEAVSEGIIGTHYRKLCFD